MDPILDLLRQMGLPRPLAYWVRELTPGWPPAFHARPVEAERIIEMPLRDVEIAGALLVVAILGLVGVALAGFRRRPKR